MGFMCQWKGQIVEKTETYITIQFSKSKVRRFNLKDLDIDFCLVTKKKVEDLGVCISKSLEAVSFNDRLKEIVLKKTKDNVQALWQNGKWEI